MKLRHRQRLIFYWHDGSSVVQIAVRLGLTISEVTAQLLTMYSRECREPQKNG